MGLQIAACKIRRREYEWPLASPDCVFAVRFYGSEEVNDSAGILQLLNKGITREDQFRPNAYEKRLMRECNLRERHGPSEPDDS